jgi:hypothetical protein
MNWTVSSVFLCSLVCNSFAQDMSQQAVKNPSTWQPPSIIEFPQSAKSTVPREMVTHLRVAGLTVTLEETALTDMQKQVGGIIGHRGDAGDSLSWLCSRGNGAHGAWVLWLMSSEVDGGTVGGFRWQRVERTVKFDTRCQTLQGSQDGVELPVALQLGTGESEVVHTFGPPTKMTDSSLLYLHEHEDRIRNEPYTAMNTLVVLLHRRVVWAIEVWKSTTS